MRKLWNEGWYFNKTVTGPAQEGVEPESWEKVDLPHTWNGIDGQDGGNDYYRGSCCYKKTLKREEIEDGEEIYLEFEGVNSSADIYVNGKLLAHHDGGYSTFRCNITEALQEENEICVVADNAQNDHVYPQMADFTFYGGIYRNVSLLGVNRTRFDLDYYGGPGVSVTPEVKGKDAQVLVQAYLSGTQGNETLTFTIWDNEEKITEAQADAANPKASMTIENVHLWNGRKDPHLYTLKAVLSRGGEVLDERCVRFGCRSFSIDPERGFILNGESYPLRGVSRHQDRPKKGNALSRADHEEDMNLICEMGANTIRLAHYQHDQYFYDLCDERGMVIWAEIPYISQHMPKGRENTISQMKELIIQNYNHPSIVVWGLSNEITMAGAKDPDLLENHRILNDLCHEMDKTRLTTVAVVSMCGIDEEYLTIPDVISYNHYYGWYGGDTSMNGEFFDNFHAKYPNRAIGMSEYGCEALNWHTSEPEQGDYTEEYQAYYHEELIKQLYTRPFIWATHVWNMFDFAADARAEGGEDGMNHKGLVTFDRKYKKDSFYAYKAWLSDEPFVHICGKRYVDRVEDVTKVTVYSNLPEVELFVNGESLGKKTSPEHFFYFEVPNKGESQLTAVAGDCKDESKIRKVEVFNEDYRMKETGDVINWFDITTPEGRFSINDKMGDIMATFRGKLFLMKLGSSMMKKKKPSEGGDKKNSMAGFTMNEGMIKMMSGFTVKRMLNMLGTAGLEPLTKEEILEINRKLNKIRKNK
ncbi:MAG: glycoside hydrolase family 2 protein [Agathobacter sp.]